RHFVGVVDDCLSRRAVLQGTLRGGLNIIQRFGEAPVVTTDHGDLEDIRSFAIDFRKLLASDDANFRGVCNILARRVKDAEVLGWSLTNRTTWNEVLEGKVIYERAGQSFGGEGVLDMWFNGALFHDDVAKVEAYESIDDDVSRGMFDQEVRRILIEGIR